jgi:hypothetical protein
LPHKELLQGQDLHLEHYVSFVVYTAYVPVAVTRTARVFVGDDTYNGYMNQSGTNFPTGLGAVDWKYQGNYKDTAGAGTQVASSTFTRMAAKIGWENSTNKNHAAIYGFSKSEVDSYIKSTITNNQSYSVGNIDFIFGVGSAGPNGKLWFFDWAPFFSLPSTYTQSQQSNTQSRSVDNNSTGFITLTPTMKSYIWDNNYALGVHAKQTNASTAQYGILSWGYFDIQISWTEYQ